MRSNSRRGVVSARKGSSPKTRAAVRPLVDALERRLLLSGTLPSFVQPSTDANYTLDNSSGSMVVDLNSGSLVVNADLSTATGWSNATVRLHNSAHIYFNSAQTLGDLELHNFSSVTVALGSTATSGNLLQLRGLSLDRFSKLDLGDNSMILHYSPSQEAADNSLIFGLLASGFASGGWGEGPWTGFGIYSSAAANDPSQKTALGFGDNSVLRDSSFAGVSLADDNEILIRDTLYGDSNLDGAVADSTTDDTQFQKGLSGLGTGWSFGDYNYDSITAGSADASLLTANASQSISQARYAPSLQVQPLSFTAYQYTPWSGDVATFTDSASRPSYAVSDYTATINWGGFVEDAQITQPSAGADYFRVNAQTTDLSNGPFTIQISFAAGGPYTGAPTSVVGMITALQLPSGAIPTSDASYTLSGSPGAVSLNVTAGTIAFNTNVANFGNYWQNLTINASGTAHLIFNSAQTLDALNLSNSALVTVSQGSSGTTGNVLQLDSLSIGATATLDLGDNSMILAYAPGAESSAASLVQSLLASGYNNGAWNGPGINSSTAANDAAQSLSVGWMDNNVGWIDSNNTVQHDASFANVSLPDFNQILVRCTLAGDANLDGVVDGTDLQQTSRGQSSLGTGWQYGDFNYNATAGDQSDFSIVSQNSGKAIAGSQYAPAFQLSLLTVQPYWNSPYIGDVATFTDTLNHNLPAGNYTADIYWGTGDLTVAQVYATNTPGQFRINTYSPVLTGANSIMMVTVQYADGSGQQGEPAIATEPIYVLQLPPGVNASADAVYSLSGLPGQVGLSLTAGSLTFDTNVSQSDGNYWKNLSFYVSGSAHAYFNAPEDFSYLQMVENATVTVSRGSGGTNGNLLNVQQLSIDPGATLDLSDNALIDWYAFGVDASSSSGATVESEAAAQMSNWLRSGYNGGTWNGTGIISSVAANDTTHATALGWMDNGFDYAAVGANPVDPSYSSFHGVSLPTKDQLLVDFTFKGDANLNGQVDTTDDSLLNIGLSHQGTGWVYGDFNYDSSINSADSNIWQANYGISTDTPNFPRAFQPAGIIINPVEGVPLSQDIATFMDLLNPSNTDPSIYQAMVNWGNGGFGAAQVTATSTPGSFRINALSPALTDPNAVITVTIQYADMNDPSPTYRGRPAAVSEPITMTPAMVDLTATAASTSEIDLKWTLNAQTALGIEVDRSTDQTDWQTLADGLPATATSYSDTAGLSTFSQYYYRVALIWSAGLSALSNIADTWTLANAPSGLTGPDPSAPASDSSITMSWTDNSDGVAGSTIYISTDGQNFSYFDDVPAGQTTYTAAGLDADTTYSFYVTSTTPGGDSPPSDIISATTASVAAPSDLQVTVNSGTDATLQWTDNSSDENGFEIDWSTDGSNFEELDTVGADTTIYDASTLTPGKSYTFRVSAIADAGQSSAATSSPQTTLPLAPTGLTAQKQEGVEGIGMFLTWDPVDGASSYLIERSDGGSDWTQLAQGLSDTQYTDSGLDFGDYSYRVSAVNDQGGTSDPSSSLDVAVAPDAPNNLSAVATDDQTVQLTWDPGSISGDHFEIDRSTDGINFSDVATTTDSSWTNSEVNATGVYSYKVYSVGDNDSRSLPSNDASAVVVPEVIGPYSIYAAPESVSELSSGSNTNLGPGWLNVLKTPITYQQAFTGFKIADRGWANLYPGATFEMTFAQPVTNGPGADLVLLDARFSVNSYSVSTDYDGFSQQYSPNLVSTGVGRSYYYSEAVDAGYGAIGATVMAGAIDLSNLGVPVGESVRSVRIKTTSNEADLLGIGQLAPVVSITPHRTGDNFGQAVTDAAKQGGNPANYVVLTDNDPSTTATAADIGNDTDLAKITLSQFAGPNSAGNYSITLSDPSSVRLFKDDGSALSQADMSLDLANPSGYLAGLLNGDVNVWVEGLQANSDFTFKASYTDTSGVEVSRDIVHMTIADWKFVDKAGDTVTQSEDVPLQYLIESSDGDPNSPVLPDNAYYKVQLNGLNADAISSISVSSDSNPDDTYSMGVVDSGQGVESSDWNALYMSPSDDDVLTARQRDDLENTLQVDAVHNDEAKVVATTQGGDSFTRTLPAKNATVSDWQEYALAQAHIDPEQWDPSQGFMNTPFHPGQYTIVKKVYDYYQSVYKRNNNLQWAGMARMAGMPVVNGINTIDDVRWQLAVSGGYLEARHIPQGAIAGLAGLGIDVCISIETTLLEMQKSIFMDLAWQHEAYLGGGIAEMTRRHDAGDLDQSTYQAWLDIDNGIKNGNQDLIWQGNAALLKREQQVVLANGYKKLASIPGVPQQMTKNVQNAMYWAGGFTGTDITNFDQRWAWIQAQMIAPWRQLSQAERDRLVARSYDDLLKQK